MPAQIGLTTSSMYVQALKAMGCHQAHIRADAVGPLSGDDTVHTTYVVIGTYVFVVVVIISKHCTLNSDSLCPYRPRFLIMVTRLLHPLPNGILTHMDPQVSRLCRRSWLTCIGCLGICPQSSPVLVRSEDTYLLVTCLLRSSPTTKPSKWVSTDDAGQYMTRA